MYFLLVIVIAAALGAGSNLDNDIPDGVGAWWWIAMVAAWLGLGFSAAMRDSEWRTPIVLGSGLVMGLAIWLTDATMTTFISGVALLFALLLARWSGGGTSRGTAYVVWGFVALALVLMPVAMNSITLKLPNLSGGTYLTLYSQPDEKPLWDGRYYNRLDNHNEVYAGLGIQTWLGYPHDAPLLRIDILREGIVLRIISVTYEARLGFLDLTLMKLEGEDLMQLESSDLSPSIQRQMRRNMLLIDQIPFEEPGWIRLPPLDETNIPWQSHAMAIAVRLLFWLILALGLFYWSPAAMERKR